MKFANNGTQNNYIYNYIINYIIYLEKWENIFKIIILIENLD